MGRIAWGRIWSGKGEIRVPDATDRGSCGQAGKRAAPLRFTLTVTALLSVVDGVRRDEGRAQQKLD